MKLITEKYRSLKPSIDYLADEVVIAQAWKKTHGYIRTFNWYADTLALDVSALGIEENARKWAAQINKRQPLYPLEFVPAAKSETWHIDKKNGWCPKEIGQPRNDNPPIRPLAHITIRDQTWATAAMMCLADAVETAQGDCSHRGGNFFDAQHRRVYSYGNRLVCEWKENHTAWFRWGNSDIFRKFFVDYQNFLKRPIEIGRAVADHESKHVFIVNLDLSKFYDHIDRGILIERLRKISKQFSHPDCPVFWEALQRLTDWKWTDEGKNISEQLGLTLGEGLPQGLVASGFFANAYMIEFDQYVGKSIGKEIDRADNIILHDYCRYVDDLRLVISAETENTKSIREKVNKWITKRLQLSAGPTLTLNLKKTKVTPLPDLDNSGSMFNRIEMVQSDLSGPADRDMLNVAIGTLESFLATENNGEIITSAKKDTKLIQLANYEHDIRADTLKRFAANRLESIMRSKRGITSYNTNAVAQNSPIENESELLAKKLIVAWMKDPSLALVLRKAIEIYPCGELFEPIFEAIFSRSNYGDGSEKSTITRAMMDYLLADLFRCACDFNGFFQYVSYPANFNPHSILELAARFAQKVISSGKTAPFVDRQALMLLAILNKPVLVANNTGSIQHSLHAILVSNPPPYQAQRSALFEVAAQITGSFDTYAAVYLDQIKDLSDQQYIALEQFAKRGGPFWLALWHHLKGRVEFKPVCEKLKWAAPQISSRPRNIKQKLSTLISSDFNAFEHEAALVKLALGLIELATNNNTAVAMPPNSIKISKNKCKLGWDKAWHPSVGSLTCELVGIRNSHTDPRFLIPNWIKSSNPEQDAEVRLIYWVGTILRAAVLGGSDFTGNRWKKGNIVTYKGLRTSWYKRRMGMMHSPESIVGEYSTVSDWFSELLMRCLQWPGFESSFVRNTDIKAIVDLQSLKSCLIARLSKLNKLFCQTSDMPTISTKIQRPKVQIERGFRIVTVQQLLPRTTDFSAADPTLNNPTIRARHREHLLAVCQLTYKTLATKLIADKANSKPAADLIVFPELAVHVDDQDVIKRLADKTQAIIFAGLVFTDHKGQLVNIARWFVPDYREGGRQWIVRDQGKAFMTEPEKQLGITGHRPCQHIIEIQNNNGESFRLSGAICYDATDISLAADLRDKTDLFVVVAHNRDVNTFDNMAAALHYHMYQHVVITNIGEFGGSTIQAPFKMPYHRLISHVHGTEQISINMADIDLGAFRREVTEYKPVKQKPAGF